MADSSRSKRKRKLEPISLDELASTTGMSGFVSYLKRPPSEYIGKPDVAEVPSNDSHTLSVLPTLGEPDRESDSLRVSDTHTLSRSDTLRDSLTEPHSVGGSVGSVAPSVLGSRSQLDTLSVSHTVRTSLGVGNRIYPTRTAQDGHSLGEQAVYAALWAEGREDGADSKVISIGYEKLASASRLHWTNVKKNLRSLQEKLAIEVIGQENSSERIGRTYRVYSYRAILERRRGAGLVWFRKSRGVELLTSNQESHTLGISPRVCDPPTLSESSTVRDPHTAPVSERHREALSDSHTPLETLFRNSFEESSSSVPSVVVEGLRLHVPEVDDDAVRQLITSCRRRTPDATDEEIVHFIHVKAGNLNIRKPLGFLLTAVPKCFDGESFRQFRAQREQKKQDQARREEQFRREAQAVLDDPDAPDEEKDWARELLAQSASLGPSQTSRG